MMTGCMLQVSRDSLGDSEEMPKGFSRAS
jgi:hypothetical protein